jgi:hypothetical protein
MAASVSRLSNNVKKNPIGRTPMSPGVLIDSVESADVAEFKRSDLELFRKLTCEILDQFFSHPKFKYC